MPGGLKLRRDPAAASAAERAPGGGEDRGSRERRFRLRGRRGGAEAFVTASATQAFLAVFVLAVLAGPTALLLQLGRPETTAPPPSASVSADLVRPAGLAGSAATNLVRVWLSAGGDDADRLAGIVLVPPEQLQLPAQRPQAPSWVSVFDARPTGPGEWSVTVTAGGGLAGGGAAYLVLVRVEQDTASALAMPARVPLPAPVEAAVAPTLEQLAVDDPLVDTITGFTAALLTGSPDLSRWLSPDSALQPGPAVCGQTQTEEVWAAAQPDPVPQPDAQLDVLATISCTHSDRKVTQTLQYPLILQARDSRWEVLAYGTALPAADPASPTTPPAAESAAPTTAPTG